MRVSIGRSWTRNRSAISASRSARPRRRDRRSARRRRCRWSSPAPCPRPPSSRWCSGEYGQHHAQLAASAAPPRRPRGAPGAAAPARSAARAPSQQLLLRQASARPARAAAARSGAISANGLSSRCLRERSSRHGRLVVGAAGEVEAADALDRHDRARPSSALAAASTASPRRAGGVAAARVDQPRARPARPGRRWAGRGSGGRPGRCTPPGRPAHISKPAIVVLGRSYGTSRTIVNRGPAVRAVDERVAEAPVARIEQLGEAVGAGRAVRSDRRARLAAGRALADREAALAELLERLGRDPLDRGERRRLERQPGQEALDRVGRRLHLDHHAARVVQHVAGQPSSPASR